MSNVIIRLQGLPWSANALDIRKFFYGLSIPDGGVHIVGGDKGDAFIAFTGDDDARQAMMRNGQPINNVPVNLMLSSRNEMQSVIAAARGDQPSESGPLGGGPQGSASVPPRGGYQPQQVPPPQQQSPYGPQSGGGGNFVGQSQFGAGGGGYGAPQNRDMGPPRGHHDMGPPRDSMPVSRDGGYVGGMGGPPSVNQMNPGAAFGGGDPMGGGGGGHNSFRSRSPIRGNGAGPSPHEHRRDRDRDRDHDRRSGGGATGSVDTRTGLQQRLCVEIRGMPSDVRYRDIRAFMKGCECVYKGVRLDRSGTARAKFTDDRQFARALDLHHTKFMGREIEVVPCSIDDWGNLDDITDGKASMKPPMPRNGDPGMLSPGGMGGMGMGGGDMGLPGQVMNCCVIAGLPPSFDKMSASRMMSTMQGYIPGSLVVETDNVGRCTGRAYLEFTDPVSVERAIMSNIFHPYTAVAISARQMRDAITALTRPPPVPPMMSLGAPMGGGGGGGSRGRDMGGFERERPRPRSRSPPRRGNTNSCVILGNLEHPTEGRDIEHFFKSYSLARRGIFVRYDASHANMGDAFVEFINEKEATRAKEDMEGKPIGNHKSPVTITLMTRSNMTDRINEHTREKRADRESRGAAGFQSQLGKEMCSRVDPQGPMEATIMNLSYKMDEKGLENFLKGYNPKLVGIKKSKDGKSTGEGWVKFDNVRDLRVAIAELTGRVTMAREVRLQQAKTETPVTEQGAGDA